MPIMSESGSERSQGNSSIILAGHLRASVSGQSTCAAKVIMRGEPDLGDDLLAQLLALGVERILELLEAALAQRAVGRPVGLVEGRAGGGRWPRRMSSADASATWTQHLFGRRVDVVERLARGGLDEVAPDEHADLTVYLDMRHPLVIDGSG